jgi:cobalt/nickel transport system permease protein
LSGGHAHGLFVHSDSLVHRLPPQCKLGAAFGFVLVAVVTPREAFWAFGLYSLMLIAIARIADVRLRFIARRLAFGAPFLLFALCLPLLASGERIEVLGIGLAREGLWSAWNIVAKASLGLAASILLGASTPMAEILYGLERLRCPKVIVSIAGFMVRYGDLITGEMRRMKIARESRGYNPRWIWQARALGAGIGTLFIRSYERGERVYLAMVSRGFAGSMPVLHSGPASPAQWALALSFPVSAAAVALLARVGL